ncbi:MAG: low temperature requirement protein A [Myxococcota bacterium]
MRFTRPRMRAKAHASHRHATWLELFFDLVFVVAIVQLTHGVKDYLTSAEVIKAIALFLPIWWIWAGHTVYATRFDTDNVLYRILTFTQMFAVVVMAVSLHDFGAERSLDYGAAYVVARATLLFLLWRAHVHVPEVRSATRLYLTGFGVGASLWAISLAVPVPLRYALWVAGFSIDFFTPWLGWWRKWLAEIPVDATHIPERFGLLNIIVLGEAVAGLVAGVSEVEWTIQLLVTAPLGFLTAVVVWWTYFSYLEEAVQGISIGSGQPYMYSHIPFVLGVAGVGIGIEKLIASVNEPVVSAGGVWIYCGGAALWVVSFYAIQLVSTPRVITRRVSWLYLASVVAFGAVAWLGVAWSPLVAQAALAGVFLSLLAARGRLPEPRLV